MRQLRHTLKKTKFSENQVISSYLQLLLEIINSLEPHQLNVSACISKFSYQSFPVLFAMNLKRTQLAGYLNIFCLKSNVADLCNLGFIYMPVRVMLKQISESEDADFFF